MSIKCTIDKNGNRIYFKNGRRVAVGSVSGKKPRCKKSTSAISTSSQGSSRSSGGAIRCTIDKNGRKHYIQGGRFVSAANSKGVRCQKRKGVEVESMVETQTETRTETETGILEAPKRRVGRPKGSKNKRVGKASKSKKRVGRPKGSKTMKKRGRPRGKKATGISTSDFYGD